MGVGDTYGGLFGLLWQRSLGGKWQESGVCHVARVARSSAHVQAPGSVVFLLLHEEMKLISLLSLASWLVISKRMWWKRWAWPPRGPQLLFLLKLPRCHVDKPRLPHWMMRDRNPSCWSPQLIASHPPEMWEANLSWPVPSPPAIRPWMHGQPDQQTCPADLQTCEQCQCLFILGFVMSHY